jgi:predicted DsbA family dithiol-disulfide isomerase
VAQDIETARRIGINGVPFYVIDGRFGVSGAQSSDLFASALERAATPQEQAG